MIFLILVFIAVLILSLYVFIKRHQSRRLIGENLGTLITMNATFGLQSAFNRTLSIVVDSVKSSGEIILVDRLRNGQSNDRDGFNFEGKWIKLDSLSINQGKGLRKLISQFAFSLALYKELKKNVKKLNLIYAFDFDTGIVVWLTTLLNPHITFYYHIADFYADSRLANAPSLVRSIIASLERRIMKHAKRSFICVEYRFEQVGNYKGNNLDVVHNSPVLEDEKKYRTKPMDIIDLPIKIGYVGTLKDTRLLFETIETVKGLKNIEFHIAGVGVDANKIESMSGDNVYFYGQMKYEETFSFYSGMDLILSAYDPKIENHKYSAPNKFYEAMLLGKSIIVAKNSGVDTLVSKHNIGYVIDYSSTSLKSLLEYLVTNEGIIDLSTKQVNSYLSYDMYSWKTQKAKVIEFMAEDLYGNY